MNTIEGSVRVFFALWPKEKQRGELSAWQLPCGGRVMLADTLHATLVFLGGVAGDRLEALKLAAEEVEAGCFEVTFDEARYWGDNHIAYAAPRVLPVQLLNLVHALEYSLTRHRFSFEKREYKPHITLRRNVRWTDEPLTGAVPVNWPVREFVLLQSEAGSYRILARFKLKTYEN